MTAEAGLEKVLVAQSMLDRLVLAASENEDDHREFINDAIGVGVRLFEVAIEHPGAQLGFAVPDKSGFSELPLEIMPPSVKPITSELVELSIADRLLEKVHGIAQNRAVHHADVAATSLYWYRVMLAAKSAERQIKLIVPQEGARSAYFNLGWAGISV